MATHEMLIKQIIEYDDDSIMKFDACVSNDIVNNTIAFYCDYLVLRCYNMIVLELYKMIQYGSIILL